MKNQRIPETSQGIAGEMLVTDYDKMQQTLRDKGVIPTKELVLSGIDTGTGLEIGPGPGYLGLEWLKSTQGTKLHWLEISEDMRKLAQKNIEVYGLESRVFVTLGDATKGFPFQNDSFDAVFTNGSLHEWSNPVHVFNEIARILRKDGRYFVSDLKRNTNRFIILIMKSMIKQRSMKHGMMTSIKAAYTKGELEDLLSRSNLSNYIVSENAFGITITGVK